MSDLRYKLEDLCTELKEVQKTLNESHLETMTIKQKLILLIAFHLGAILCYLLENFLWNP